jgi:hypothetical protein
MAQRRVTKHRHKATLRRLEPGGSAPKLLLCLFPSRLRKHPESPEYLGFQRAHQGTEGVATTTTTEALSEKETNLYCIYQDPRLKAFFFKKQ